MLTIGLQWQRRLVKIVNADWDLPFPVTATFTVTQKLARVASTHIQVVKASSFELQTSNLHRASLLPRLPPTPTTTGGAVVVTINLPLLITPESNDLS